MDTIFSRRSIRKYLPKPVTRDLIEKILKAGMNAPSAGDEQPWHFIIIDKHYLLQEISEIHPYAKMLKDAPVAILVCGDLSILKFKDLWIQDCSAASENMLLAAHDMRLGAVWIGVYPVENLVREVRNILNIPQHIVPFSIIGMGYPAEEKTGRLRYDKSKVHNNTWQKL